MIVAVKVYWDQAAGRTSVALPSWVILRSLAPGATVATLVRDLGRNPDRVSADERVLAMTWRFGSDSITFGALVGDQGPASVDLSNVANAMATYGDRLVTEVSVPG